MQQANAAAAERQLEEWSRLSQVPGWDDGVGVGRSSQDQASMPGLFQSDEEFSRAFLAQTQGTSSAPAESDAKDMTEEEGAEETKGQHIGVQEEVQFLYVFAREGHRPGFRQRAPPQYEDISLSLGDWVVISVEHGPYVVAPGVVHAIGSTFVVVRSDTDLRCSSAVSQLWAATSGPRMLSQSQADDAGVGSSIDAQEFSHVSSNLAAAGARRVDLSSAGMLVGHSLRRLPSIVFRLDKNDPVVGMKLARNNVLRLCIGNDHTWADEELASKRNEQSHDDSLLFDGEDTVMFEEMESLLQEVEASEKKKRGLESSAAGAPAPASSRPAEGSGGSIVASAKNAHLGQDSTAPAVGGKAAAASHTAAAASAAEIAPLDDEALNGDHRRRSLLIDMAAPRFLQSPLPWEMHPREGRVLYEDPSLPRATEAELKALRHDYDCLNGEQQAAVRRILDTLDYTCVQGMPGTGENNNHCSCHSVSDSSRSVCPHQCIYPHRCR